MGLEEAANGSKIEEKEGEAVDTEEIYLQMYSKLYNPLNKWVERKMLVNFLQRCSLQLVAQSFTGKMGHYCHMDPICLDNLPLTYISDKQRR